jgi:hypothetical protein
VARLLSEQRQDDQLQIAGREFAAHAEISAEHAAFKTSHGFSFVGCISSYVVKHISYDNSFQVRLRIFDVSGN